MFEESIRVICNVTLYSPCLWASFHSLSPPSVVSAKQWNFIKSQYELMKLGIQCTETNYSRCTVKSSENICSSSGGAQEKVKTGWNSVYHQIRCFFFWVSPSLNANVFFAGFKNLTPCMTKLRVVMPCFPYFTDNSNVHPLFSLFNTYRISWGKIK